MSNVANVKILSSKVDADLTDYPIYIDLSDLPSSFWDEVANGGGDIRVYKSDGTTQLAREVVSCDTATDTGELHVKYTGTLSSSTDTTIQIWADGSSTEPASDSTYGSENVWSDYGLVSHDGGITDSSGNITPANNGVTSQTTQAKMGSAGSFNGSSNYITTGADSGIWGANPSIISFSCWARIGSFSSKRRIFDTNDGTDPWFSNVTDVTTGLFRGQYDDGARLEGTSSGALSLTTWYYLVSVFDKNNDGILYVDALATNIGASVSTGDYTDGGTTYIGRKGTVSSEFLNGYLDEVRASNVNFSSDWISTEYNNQNSPSTFYTATASGSTYTLTASAGSFTLTGKTASLLRIYTLAITQASFTLTGQNISFSRDYCLIAGTGEFILTGIQVGLSTGGAINLLCGTGNFALTGQDISFIRIYTDLIASAGNFTLTGQNIEFKRTYKLNASTGSFTLTGQDTGINKAYNILLNTGSFTLTGQDIGFVIGLTFICETGEFVLTYSDPISTAWQSRTKPAMPVWT